MPVVIILGALSARDDALGSKAVGLFLVTIDEREQFTVHSDDSCTFLKRVTLIELKHTNMLYIYMLLNASCNHSWRTLS